ncbi:hypothetical protein CEUSTIGMA_g12630.t1 [Chlamydomonas eustigma]|uniref:Fe2OG dioxygenase domain-containing protein n=1 Tax=Chlamydomonas eustigma TaxID=1157962 RepID=A0A250XQY4_9CHLO|nr:hypothetical protein CEUSTIGMA_g12630.t1 [Chlamydomonas eustigma]|eukprot:GAX85210.1 hypothetical protein CEUSTIGMA_g12630.t1 [Chlamydomonas eustigma]
MPAFTAHSRHDAISMMLPRRMGRAKQHVMPLAKSLFSTSPSTTEHSTAIKSFNENTVGVVDLSPAAAAALQQRQAILFIGFDAAEVELVRTNISSLIPEVSMSSTDQNGHQCINSSTGYHTTPADTEGGTTVEVSVSVLNLGRTASFRTLTDILQVLQHLDDHAVREMEAADASLAEGRVVLLCGGELQQYGAMINNWLLDIGVAPAVVGARVPERHDDLAVSEVVQQLRMSHARYHELLQPMRMQTGVYPPKDARVIMNAVLDAGEVPSTSLPGQYRQDEGHLVVLDGLCSDSERTQILDWITSPGHDHSGVPPAARWEQACVDRAGDQATWGLRPEVLEALQHEPPEALVAVQSRLAALYHEYDICHMPASQLSDGTAVRRRIPDAAGERKEDGAVGEGDEEQEEEEEEEEEVLSSFVGNAVMVGDPCAWHVDADPSSFPPSSPWVHNYGYYHNREPGKPLFVSMLMYLNDTWPEDYHSETLFLDPESQTGVFVRPAAGRVVLMDQDVPHRISQPSSEAGSRPRYSLVWKLVFFPKETSKAVSVPTLSRKEWGEPVRYGSANSRYGVMAWCEKD